MALLQPDAALVIGHLSPLRTRLGVTTNVEAMDRTKIAMAVIIYFSFSFWMTAYVGSSAK